MGCKIVHIVTVPDSLHTFLGGQIGYMKNCGFEVEAVSSPGQSLDDFGDAEEIDVHSVPMPRKISPLRDLYALILLYRTLKRIRPHVVHAHTPKAGLLGMIAAWLARVPIRIYHIRGLPMLTLKGVRRWLLRTAEALSCKLAGSVLCVSQSVRRIAITQDLCPAEKIRVLCSGSGNGVDGQVRFNPSSIDFKTRTSIRDRLKLAPTDLVLGYVGRIARDKGIEELAEAWDSIREDYSNVYLVILGERDFRDSVSEAVFERLESDLRVSLVGNVAQPEHYYAAMDVCVLPTYREGLPNVLLEAAAMGCPAVATRVPGCVDAVVDGESGTLVPAQDYKALAGAIRGYLESETLRRTHGENGRLRVLQEFQQERIWQALASRYRELLHAQDLSLEGLSAIDRSSIRAA